MVWGFDETFPASPASNLKPDDPSNPAMHSELPGISISITVYFNDPAKLCDESYSVPEGSVGDRVWYQLTDDDFLEIPLDEDVDALSGLGFYAGAALLLASFWSPKEYRAAWACNTGGSRATAAWTCPPSPSCTTRASCGARHRYTATPPALPPCNFEDIRVVNC